MKKYIKIFRAIKAMAHLGGAALLLSAASAGAQVKAAKAFTPDDYPMWGRLGTPVLAPDAKWVSFPMGYEAGTDTLFIKSTDGKKDYAFPGASFGSYSNTKWLAYRMNAELILLNPETGERKDLGIVGDYTFSGTGKYCVYDFIENGSRSLCMLDLQGGKSEVIRNVAEYSYNKPADALAYSTGTQIGLLHFNNKAGSDLVYSGKGNNYFGISWQDNGGAFAFVVHKQSGAASAGTSVGYYQIGGGKRYDLQIGGSAEMVGKQVGLIPKLKISDDGQRIFIPIETPLSLDSLTANRPEIWNASSKEIYPRQHMRRTQQQTDIWVWWPHNGNYRQATDSFFTKMALSGDQRCALVWDPRQNEPHPNLAAPIDYYIKNLETGSKELLLVKQSPAEITVLTSPGGRYLSYFRERHWYIYDFKKKTHTSITAKLGTAFFKEDFDWPEDAPPYGNPGWTENDEYIILYDKFDIWLMRPDGSGAHRITQGRNEQRVYRICLRPDQRNKVNFDGLQNGIFKKGGPYILRGKSSLSITYFHWDSSGGITPLLSGEADLASESFTQKGDLCAIEQTYSMAPRIVMKLRGKKSNILYRSNKNLDKTTIDGVRLVSYTGTEGKSLSGALYYPANYDPKMDYPMIVHIYQKQAWDYQRYVIPSLRNVSGFNIRNLTLSGYFVFLPDISYEMGYPGRSAVDCVTAAVEAALKTAPVDRKRIGLIGHSFGGYETNYIISQTDIFAAAISGSAINDFISFYHYVVPGFERPNFWFQEYGQFRMAGPYFANRQGYMDNSPLYHAEQINTPLLCWAGRDDTQVHYFQMISLHLALRRLGKVNYALLYPGQGHIISDPEFQRDLTLRISDWFGYYLKDGPMPYWMKSSQ